MSYFTNETAVHEKAPGTYTGFVSNAWNIGENPNGGYLLAISLQALTRALPHPDPLTVTTHYLRPGVPDAPCEVHTELIRQGRTLSTGRATLVQDGKPRLTVLASFGDLDASVGVSTTLTVEPPELPGPDACIQRSGETQGLGLPIASRLDTRLHPDQATAGKAGKAEISGYIRFTDGQEPSPIAVAQFADAFPPSPFGLLGVVGWVPTIELTVQLRRKPTPGFIRARLHTRDLYQGRMIEDGMLWDSEGNLVAQSRQLGLVMAGD